MAARRIGATALVAALLAVPALTGCGDEGATASAPTAPAGDTGGAAGIMLSDSGVSVAEARALPPGDDLVAVRAYVIVAADGSARLCDALAESSPPQCGCVDRAGCG